LLLIKEFIPVLIKLIINTEDRLNLAEQEVERARGVLLERTKETKTLNKLHEKEWQIYLQEWNREEQKLVDEIAITGHFRKNLS
jgi:flagellar export protein FliJ